MTAAASGLRLALTTLTVWPARGAGRVDRRAAAVAMALAPAVGGLLGAGAGAICYGVVAGAGAAPLLAAVLAVTWLALATRALHLDGLADTADALGSYAGAERALAIMKSPEVGPFGVVALVLVLGIDVAALTSLAARHQWWAIVVAVAAGRVAITLACCRGVPAARPDGLGALVAGTVPVPLVAAWGVAAAAGAYPALSVRAWLGPVGVLAGLAAAALLVAHARRRVGGITGDVLGACCELASAVTLAVFALT